LQRCLLKFGFTNVAHVVSGFEGDLDENNQRGNVNGWRNVEKISKIGTPAEKPRKSMVITRGWIKSLILSNIVTKACRHDASH
jgi:hypothetical protein